MTVSLLTRGYIVPPAEITLVAPGGAAPILTVVSPTEGSVISRNTSLVMDAVADATVTGLRRVILSVLMGGSTVEELVHGGISFTAPYSGGVNSRAEITRGYRFTLLRLGGWRGSAVSLRVIAIDIRGTVAQKTIAVPDAIYTWQVIDQRGPVTPFVGDLGR